MGSSDIMFTAVWNEVPTHKVTYDVNGGTDSVPTQTVHEGETFTYAAYSGTKAGYYFKYWATSSNLVKYPGNTDTMGTSDINLHAVWWDNPKHTVSYNVNGGSGSVSSQSVSEGATFNVKSYSGSKAGYTFSGWAYNGETYHYNDPIVMGTSDITLTAVWTPKASHTVTYYDMTTSGSDHIVSTQTVTEGLTYTLINYSRTRDGYNFVGWRSSALYQPGDVRTMGTTDEYYFAEWEEIPYYEISFDVNGGSEELPSILVQERDTYQLPSYNGTQAGLEFIGWSIDKYHYYVPGEVLTATEDVTFTADWATKDFHVVSYDIDGGTGSAPASQNVIEDLKFTVAEYTGTKTGFTFGGWLYNGTSYAPGAQLTMGTSDIVFTANWTQKPSHTVTYNTDGGSETVPSVTVVEDEEYILPEYTGTKPGSIFNGWWDAASSIKYNPGTPRTMGTVDMVYKAHWDLKPTHTVTYDVDGGSSSVPSQTVREDMPFEVASYTGTKSEYIFDGWVHGITSYKPGDTAYMGTSDITLHAVWKAKPSHRITYDANGGSDRFLPVNTTVREDAKYTLGEYSGERSGFIFLGWTYKGSSQPLQPGTMITMGTEDIVLTAQWESKTTHTATYIVTEGLPEGIVPSEPAPGPQTVAEEEPFTVLGYTGKAYGYSFDGWTYSGGECQPGDDITMGESDITFTVKWTPKASHTVSYDPAGGSNEVDSQTVPIGEKFIIASYRGTKEGFYFTGWTYNDVSYQPNAEMTMGESDIEFVAVWTAIPTHKVSYNVDGGSVPVPDQYVAENSVFYAVQYTGKKTGFDFNGWIYGLDIIQPGGEITMGESDIELVAAWTQKLPNTVSYNVNGGSKEVPSQSVREGEEFILPEYDGTKRGYIFKGWSTTSSIDPYKPGTPMTMGSSDMLFIAVWSENKEHIVRYNVGEGTGPVPEDQMVNEGEPFTLASYTGTRVGYTFGGWYYGATGRTYPPGQELRMTTQNMFFTADWIALPTHLVMYDVDGGTGGVVTQTIVENTQFQIAFYDGTKEGFNFAGWLYNGVTYTPGNMMTMGTSNITFKAAWSGKPVHEVSYNVNGGTDYVAPQSVAEDNKFLVAEYSGTKEGHVFAGWFYNGATYQPNAEVTMGTSDIEFTAVWNVVNAHTVSYDVDGGSETIPDQTVNEDDTFTLVQYTGAKSGYSFGGWLYNGAIYQPGKIMTMGSSDMIFKAVWNQKASHTVSYNVNGGSGSVPSQTVVEDSRFTIASYSGTKPDYTFAGWLYDGTTYSSGTQMTMGKSDIAFTAVWSDEPVPPTPDRCTVSLTCAEYIPEISWGYGIGTSELTPISGGIASILVDKGTKVYFGWLGSSVDGGQRYRFERWVIDDVMEVPEPTGWADIDADLSIELRYTVWHRIDVVQPSVGGSITPVGPVWVKEGGDTTFTAHPDSGYSLKRFIVTPRNSE